MTKMTSRSVIDAIRRIQRDKGLQIRVPKSGDRIGFAFSTKDRVSFTLRSLASIDSETGFDIIWIDGSDTEEGKELPNKHRFRNARLSEVHLDVRGGADAAICYGLRRLLDLGYDYCGLIENDVVFKPGWFGRLLELFHLAGEEGLVVGAATVRNYEGRVIEYRPKYTINWNIGAGMVLFTRPAVRVILDQYENLLTTARMLRRFYAETLGVDLRRAPQLFLGRIDRRLSGDDVYDLMLFREGMISVGTIPSLAYDLEFDVWEHYQDRYVTSEKSGVGVARPFVPRSSLYANRLIDPIFSLAWTILNSNLWLLRLVRVSMTSSEVKAVRNYVRSTKWLSERLRKAKSFSQK